MAGPTTWELYEYEDKTPVPVFTAGAGGHPEPDDFGCKYYVGSEEGWRSSPDMRDGSQERLGADGNVSGGLYKAAHIVTLSGWYTAPNLEAMYGSMRRVRATLGAQRRRGRLLADDSDAMRLYMDVVRGGAILLDPQTTILGEWSMAFRVNNPILLSEARSVAVIGAPGANRTGMSFAAGFAMGFNTEAITAEERVYNAGTASVPWTGRVYGPASSVEIYSNATNRSLRIDTAIPDGSYVEVDSANRSIRLDGQNIRGAMHGQWFPIVPGLNEITFIPQGSGDGTRLEITYASSGWE